MSFFIGICRRCAIQLILLLSLLLAASAVAYLVVSQNKGNPVQTPKYCNPYYGDPNKVPLIIGNPHLNLWTFFGCANSRVHTASEKGL